MRLEWKNKLKKITVQKLETLKPFHSVRATDWCNLGCPNEPGLELSVSFPDHLRADDK